MQAVGKIGSYVSGPFHPFGGAVDIIVVEQPDGTYKSSPWYVCFGKFQGVLKTKEKVVNIAVNGVEADFHMYLDHKGEAYFLKEVDAEEGEDPCAPSLLLDDSTKSERNGITGFPRSNSRRAQILGLVFGRKSRKEGVSADRENSRVYDRESSLKCAEIAADLLDLKWSTNLVSSRWKGDNSSPELENVVKENGVDVKCLSSDYQLTAVSIESVGERTDLSHSERAISDKLGLAKSDFCVSSMIKVSEVPKSDSEIQVSVENARGPGQFFNYSEASESSRVALEQSIQQKKGSFCHGGCVETRVHTETVQNANMKSEPGGDVVHALETLNVKECLKNGDEFSLLREGKIYMAGGTLSSASEDNVPECCSQPISVHQSNGSFRPGDARSVSTATASSYSTYSPVAQPTVFSGIQAPGISQQEQLLLDNLDDVTKYRKFNCTNHEGKGTSPTFSSTITNEVNEGIDAGHCSVFSLEQSIIDDYIGNTNSPKRRTRSTSNDIYIDKTGNIQSKECVRTVKSLPSIASVSNNFEASDLGHSSSHSSYMDAKACSNINHQSPGSQTVAERREGTANPSLGKCSSTGDSYGRTRRGWPFSFNRSRTISVSHFENNGIANSSEVVVLNNSNGLEGGKDSPKIKVKKKILRTRAPTSAQVASLNLKEGKNTVVFTFFTSMLREQQVDARIFLWRWDARIVISDVDGTITRSDLLGQVMPLVGMDWSQTGVAHLFSAIKENGYQLIFLSARSISQSFHTRQFLCNIRQDGKALPDGPVVISPDGLFPSLFREVVRRTPHEFKISCLEDIRALFPPDRNPFYAGFGNRDTDEFSYLKVGIPRGKIFTINPKGEIVVNHHVHTKSYLSLHALVHGMFPSMSSSEQEDYNSWNYWKLPPPLVDL